MVEKSAQSGHPVSDQRNKQSLLNLSTKASFQLLVDLLMSLFNGVNKFVDRDGLN
jgi:hypothetical protein